MNRKSLTILVAVLAILAASLASAAPMKPKSVIHIITVKWNASATPAQIDKAIKGAEAINFPGLKNVWTRPIKVQLLPPGYKTIIVMEFESEEALKKYGGSEAQKKWYEVYMPVREESSTHDISN